MDSESSARLRLYTNTNKQHRYIDRTLYVSYLCVVVPLGSIARFVLTCWWLARQQHAFSLSLFCSSLYKCGRITQHTHLLCALYSPVSFSSCIFLPYSFSRSSSYFLLLMSLSPLVFSTSLKSWLGMDVNEAGSRTDRNHRAMESQVERGPPSLPNLYNRAIHGFSTSPLEKTDNGSV